MTAAEVQSLTIAQLDEAIFRAASDLSFLRKIRKAKQELEDVLEGRTNLETLAGKPASNWLAVPDSPVASKPEDVRSQVLPPPASVVPGKASGKP